MVHGGLLSLRILFHIIILVNPDVGLKDHYKVECLQKALLNISHPWEYAIE
jgi:hypothetical protein